MYPGGICYDFPREETKWPNDDAASHAALAAATSDEASSASECASGRSEAATAPDVACYRPIRGHMSPDGKSFTPVGDLTSNIFHDKLMAVPCGKCIGCEADRALDWQTRMVCESYNHDRKCMITLTYSDQALNLHKSAGGAWANAWSLDPRDWQEFMKRLRWHLDGYHNRKIRFFHCGEYGDDKGRPHLHAAIFGEDWHEDRRFYKNSKRGFPLFKCEALDEIWGHGETLISLFTPETAGYIARYCLKKRALSSKGTHHGSRRAGHIHPEYQTMSRRPGLGAHFLEKFESDVYPSDEVRYDGRKYRVPKYFDAILKREQPELLEELKQERRLQSERHRADRTPDRLATREALARSRAHRHQKERY